MSQKNAVSRFESSNPTELQPGATADLFRNQTAEALKPHQDRAKAFIQSIRHAAAELFDIPYRVPESSRVFEMVGQPYWATHKWSSKLSPIPEGLVDRFRSFEMQKQKLLYAALTQG